MNGLFVSKWKIKSVHTVAIVLVTELAEELNGAIKMADGDGGMVDAIEGGGLDGGVVNHVLEDDFIADLKGTGKAPGAHEVAGET